MLNINLKSRLKNKAFLVAMVSAIVLLVQQLGFKDLIPANYADVTNSVLTILTMLGIVVDTSTSGIGDQVGTQSVQVIQSTQDIQTLPIEAITTPTTDTSASAKIVVVNPDNIVAIGTTVNSTSAVAPN